MDKNTNTPDLWLFRSPIADGTNDLRYVLDLESFQEVYSLMEGV